ncbi:hypothetical protein TIFTF001_028647 [Ficus carica]|uniref:Uncharacterized protein n=1 Tax=Ficus carica TaxID=3494 RepID=A0AA88DQD2_FICCA|nr:hypothetical protein TIFTF001_028647 [Ficus carica]
MCCGRYDAIRVIDVGEDSRRLKMVMTGNVRHGPKLHDDGSLETTVETVQRMARNKQCSAGAYGERQVASSNSAQLGSRPRGELGLDFGSGALRKVGNTSDLGASVVDPMVQMDRGCMGKVSASGGSWC